MFRNALAGLRAHRARLSLTMLAVMLGVGFIAGTFVLTDTMQAGFDREFTASADKVDVAVLPAPSDRPDPGAAEKPQDRRLPVALLAKVRALPGVTDAQGTVHGDAPLIGKDGRAYGDFGTVGLSVPADGPLRRYTVTSGRIPAGADEAALSDGVAEGSGYRPGDRIKVLDPRGRARTFRLVGVVDLGIDMDVTMRGGVVFSPATAATMVRQKGYAEIDVAGDVTAAQVAAAIGPGPRVLSGEQLAERQARTAGADTKMITAGLLSFGLVALLVAGLVIYNTFTILVTQRARELALLRCLGATRRQVFGGVVIESALVGVIGSVAGLAIGVGLGLGGLALLDALGADLPPATATAGLTGRTVAVALTVGIVMTMLSALVPARRATKVAPLAALRTEPEPGERRFRLGRLRWAMTVFFAALGLTATGLGLFWMKPGEAAFFTVAGGGTLVFVAVVAVMPLLVRPLGRLVGRPAGRIAGLPGRLAVQNVRRAPVRTATTTIALTVGVALVSLFAVVGASGKATAARKISEQFPVDYRLHTALALEQTVPRSVPAALRPRRDLFASVTEVRSTEAWFGNGEETAGAITASSLGTTVRPEMRQGALRDLRGASVMVSETVADRQGLAVGRRATVKTRRGPVTLTVVAVYGGEDLMLPEVVLPEPEFDRYFGERGDTAVFLKLAEGAAPARARAAIDAAIRPHPVVKVSAATALKDEFNTAIDTMLGVFAALLGLTILIALFGIANTLTLSVVERTRESALLRALGVTRRQLRGMLSTEAVIMSLIGALVGVGLGTVFGWAATRSLSASFVFALPYGQILAFVGLAGLAGLAAAVLPARRAARASVVEALAAGDS